MAKKKNYEHEMNQQPARRSYAQEFVDFLVVRELGYEETARLYLDDLMKWSLIQSIVKNRVKRNYDRYGMVMCSMLYAVKSEDFFEKKTMLALKERLWEYNYKQYLKDKDTLDALKKEGKNSEWSTFIAKKINVFCTNSLADIWNDILVEECKPIYPNLTKSALRNYILLRKHGVDFKDSDEDWMAAVAGDENCKNLGLRACYNIRQAFIPVTQHQVSFEVYKERFENREMSKKVKEWQTENSDRNIYECCMDLQLPFHKADILWDENYSCKQENQEGDTSTTREERENAVFWLNMNPDGTIAEYMSELNLSVKKAVLTWDNACLAKDHEPITKTGAKVFIWKKNHPSATPAQCAKALNSSISQVTKYWMKSYPEDEAMLIATGKMKPERVEKETGSEDEKKVTRSEAEVVIWRISHPEGTTEECMKSIVRSQTTVRKYWDSTCTLAEAEKVLMQPTKAKRKNSLTGHYGKKTQKALDWFKKHPEGKVTACMKECNVSDSTAYAAKELIVSNN